MTPDRFDQLFVETLEEEPTCWRLSRHMRATIAGMRFEVPAGFVTDLASVPALFRPLIPKHGAHSRPAVLHDWLVREGRVSRRTADSIFRDALRVTGNGWLKRRVMWSGVRIGAGLSALGRLLPWNWGTD